MGLRPEKNNRPLIYYAICVVIIMLLLNALVFPALMEYSVREVGYSEFLQMVEDGRVKTVSKNDSQITFLATDEKDREAVYKTGLWEDPDLTETLKAAGVDFAAEIPTQTNPILTFLFSWILPVLAFSFLGRIMMNRMNGGRGAMSFGKSNAKIYAETSTGKTFADVAGEDEAKEALQEIVDFLHNPGKYTAIGASLPKGALLVGPPGTGKTLLARAVAGEAHVPFFSISGSEFVEMFVGMGAAKVRDLFAQAQEKAPCIVFIDEIDTIGKKRDGGSFGGNDEREQTLNQLLTEMDGFNASKGVVILAATNRPESLDKALLRPGRFDRRIPVELPDLAGREAILRVHAAKVHTAPDIDYGVIARSTSGTSGAELANIVNEAALRAVRMGRDTVLQEDLQESVEVVLAGYQRKNAVISDEEKAVIACHEIGHALTAALQSGSAPVQKITIIPRTSGALGYTMQVEEGERVLLSREDALNRITTLTGGRAAEELIYHTVTSGAANDIEQATKLARAMVSRYGMSDQFGMVALEQVNNAYLSGDTSLICAADTASKIDAEVISTVKACHDRAAALLAANEPKLRELSAFLLERETITGAEFMDILQRKPAEK